MYGCVALEAGVHIYRLVKRGGRACGAASVCQSVDRRSTLCRAVLVCRVSCAITRYRPHGCSACEPPPLLALLNRKIVVARCAARRAPCATRHKCSSQSARLQSHPRKHGAPTRGARARPHRRHHRRSPTRHGASRERYRLQRLGARRVE